MVDFDYVRPRTLAEACALLAADPEARALSGGQTLIPALKQRLARPARLVDLQGLAELQGIAVTDTHVEIGAMTRHADVAGHAGVAAAIPALAFLAGGIAHPQVRHMGTIGGSIANNDPAADYPGAVVGLGAEIVTSQRTIVADDFFTGLFATALEPGELVVRVRFPRALRAGYCKIPNPASGYVTAGAFVAHTAGGVRVAINGAGPCVFRADAIERRLAERFAPDALDGVTLPAAGLNGDLHASPAYRAQLAVVAVRRALARALGDGDAPSASPHPAAPAPGVPA